MGLKNCADYRHNGQNSAVCAGATNGWSILLLVFELHYPYIFNQIPCGFWNSMVSEANVPN